MFATCCSECGAEIELTRDVRSSGSPWSICRDCWPAIAPAPAPPSGAAADGDAGRARSHGAGEADPAGPLPVAGRIAE